TVDGRLELFSDLELVVITAGRLPPTTREDLVGAGQRLASDFGYRSRRFHVDVLLRERSRLGALPPGIFTYELRTAGRTVWGRQLLGEVRPVSLANLDRANTREILVKRLWHLAEALPADWLRGQAPDEVASRDLGVALARQPLDLTTVLLPEVGV